MALRPRAYTRGVGKYVQVSGHASADVIVRNYEELRELGAGAFGKVSLVRDKRFGIDKVIKVVSTKDMQRETIEMMKKEIELLRSLDHPSIVKLYEYAEDAHKMQLIFVLEYINGGDCLDLIKDSAGPLEEPLLARLMYQVIVALSYCHQNGVIHRDIKPDNMMVLRCPETNDIDCKLIDFGLAERAHGAIHETAGTPKYMAPEVHRRMPYTQKADVWSVAVTALHLFIGEGPFLRPYNETIPQYLKFGDLEPRLESFDGWQIRTPEAKSFARDLLIVDPAARPSARDLVDHDWFIAYQPPPCRFPKEMARSLAAYTSAPPIVRCLLFSIAARIGSPNFRAVGATFLAADSDGDGLITHEDLREALQDMDGWKWWWDSASKVDVDKVLETADLNHSGGLCFSEFAAACLIGHHESDDDLAKHAFYALDHARCGQVVVKDIRNLFRERDVAFLDSLPQDRPFTLEEWVQCIHEFIKECPSSPKSRSPSSASTPEEMGFSDYFIMCKGHRARNDTGGNYGSFVSSCPDDGLVTIPD